MQTPDLGTGTRPRSSPLVDHNVRLRKTQLFLGILDAGISTLPFSRRSTSSTCVSIRDARGKSARAACKTRSTPGETHLSSTSRRESRRAREYWLKRSLACLRPFVIKFETIPESKKENRTKQFFVMVVSKPVKRRRKACFGLLLQSDRQNSNPISPFKQG